MEIPAFSDGGRIWTTHAAAAMVPFLGLSFLFPMAKISSIFLRT